MHRLRRHFTFANVIACLALFIALGGASYAAFKLPRNSVGTRQLKNGAVTGAKIRKGAVTAASIAPGTIDPATLGTVPSATNAAHATTADRAAKATSADTAGTANTLAGLAPSAFASADRVISGRASYTAPTLQPILSIPGGLSISVVPGSGGQELHFASSSGSGEWEISDKSGGASILSGESVDLPFSDLLADLWIDNDTTRQGRSLRCFKNVLTQEDACVAIGG